MLPKMMQKLFGNGGAGSKLRPDILPIDGTTLTINEQNQLEAKTSVTLSDAVDSTSSTTAASSLAVKTAYDKAVEAQAAATAAQSAAATAGGKADAAQAAVSAAQGTADEALAKAEEALNGTGGGSVTLSDAVDSTSSTTAASSKAVKTAYDKAVSAQEAADAASSKADSALAKADEALSGAGGGSGITMAAPKVSGPEFLGIGQDNVFQLSATPGLANTTVTQFQVTLTGLNNQTVDASGNAAEVTFAVPAGATPGEQKTLTAVAVDSLGNRSAMAVLEVQTASAYIVSPEIISPVDCSYKRTVTIVTSEFAVGGGLQEDEHVSTDWKITRDAGGSDIVVEAKASKDLLSHTFTGLSLTADETYYAFARHTGRSYGTSTWGKGAFTAIEGVTSPSGRTLYPSGDGKSITMEYTEKGIPRKMKIAYAQYRTKAKFGTYETDTPLKNYSSKNRNGNGDIDGDNDHDMRLAGGNSVSDAQIDKLWAASIDEKTAKQNCDVWMQYANQTDSKGIVGVPAVQAARAVILDRKGCDIPTITQLIRIAADANTIDSLDPTVDVYPAYALGTKNSDGFWDWDGAGNCFASTDYDSTFVRSVRFDGSSQYYYKSHDIGVCPVQEV